MAAIELKSTVNLQDSGGTYTTIGISDAIKLHSMDEIFNFIYCSATTDLYQNPRYREIGVYKDISRAPFIFSEAGSNIIIVDGDEAYTPEDRYGKVVWLYGGGLQSLEYINQTISDLCVVTNMDVKKFIIHVEEGYRTYWGNDYATRQTNLWSGEGKAMDFGQHLYYQDNGVENFDPTNPYDTHKHAVTDICPFLIVPLGDGTYFFANLLNTRETIGGSTGPLLQSGRQFNRLLNHNGTGNSFSWNPNAVAGQPTSQTFYQYSMDFFGTIGEKYSVMYSGGAPQGLESFYYRIVPRTADAWAKIQMMSGVWFYTTQLYKPIITDGYVSGYGGADAASDFDNYSYNKGNQHDIPPAPPGPGPVDPWDVDPETYGWGGGEVSGMVKYYLLTAGEMGQLQSAIASNANWTIDYLNCVVSCFVVPNSGIFFDAPIPTTVKFVLDNATQWDTGVSCSRIQGTKNKSGGTIEIPRLTHTFYDFEPYSDYSIYIPFCGRIPIKGNLCLGREIKVTYYPDVPTCSLTAVVSCGGVTIAIAKGSFGTMTPVTSNGSDRKTAAVIGDVAPIITGIGTGIVGVALGNPLIVGAGAAQALGGIMGGVKETVQSYAYSVGSTGDSSFFGAGNRCYYYANYPIIDDVVNNSMFGHSVGYLCNTVDTLSSFTGFTICANPHVTFSATAEERDEIERLLSMGVIL